MPLPTPRFVISSPNHMSNVQPAVSVRTMMTSLPAFTFGSAPWRLKRNAYPVDCAAASATVR